MNETVTVPADLREKLANAGGPVPLCDDAGQVIGYALTGRAPGRDPGWRRFPDVR